MSSRTFIALLPVPAMLALALAQAPAARAQSRDGLEVQKARAEHVTSRGRKVYYTTTFDLSGLPDYVPAQVVTGTIRMWGNNYIADSTLGERWADGFRRFHPGVQFDFSGLKSGLVATAGLVSGRADIVGNRRITFAELESFERMFNYDPLQVSMAMGSYDVPGWMTTFAVVVPKGNPLTGLTLAQLDGIFGTARDGGWEGTSWHPEAGRSAAGNIRTWGQLGLTGEWADKPIHVYGLNLRYNNCDMFEHVVFHGGDKWNEGLHEYANFVKADGTLAIAAAELMKDLAKDPYGLGWSGIENVTPRTKALALAAKEGGPYVPLTIENVQNRSYPLGFEMFFYVNRPPGRPLDPKVREFLRYVLSREGQDAVQKDGKYLPLTAEVVRENLRKLD